MHQAGDPGSDHQERGGAARQFPLGERLTGLTRRALLGCAGALALPGLRAFAAGAPVRIGWLKGTNDLTLSKARGTLEAALAKEGIAVEWRGPFPAAAPAMEALNARAIDITVGSSTSFVTSLAQGAPAVVFAYQHMGPNAEAIIVRNDSPITRLEQLIGRSVAVNRGGTGEYLLVKALETAGLDVNGVKRVYLGPTDAGPAFAGHQVDAWAIWDPFLSIALMNYNARVLVNGAGIGSENAIVMIAHKDFASERRAVLQMIYDVLRQDNAWSIENKAAAGEIWAKELGAPLTAAEPFGANNAVPAKAAGASQSAEMSLIAQWYIRNGLIPSAPDMANAVIDLSR